MNKAEARRVTVRLTKADNKIAEALILIREAQKLMPLSGSELDDNDRSGALNDLETIIRYSALRNVRSEAMRWDGLYLAAPAVDTTD